MSMLQKLKETTTDSIFEEGDDLDMDVDNMDFPLPDDLSAGGTGGLEEMMAKLSAGQAQRQPPAENTRDIAVVNTPQGVQRVDPSVYKNWICVYPCYIDADKSLEQGRRISKAKAVTKPHAYHMAMAVQQLGGMSVVYEGKKHPADWANPGRVKVQLKNGQFFSNPKYTSRKQLIHAIAELLPKIQKENEIPKNIVSPMTTLREIEEIANEQRRAQGLPPIETTPPPAAPTAGAIEAPESSKPKKVKKPKMKTIVRR
ncbi:hypothetical protein INT44_004528 [Umbelopsis vinacea]|uniref:Signal recognition particle, SRP19 subunit n=1 Tax=Umbelopsis vinacea TaxID=44442 RepID=A0A8H7QBK4_9FUNG|nr:hypothetical protein INT44_004528 [Umbelopsis vinacea]